MRVSKIIRETKETNINLGINLDGGPVEIYTGIGFFDHMLTAFAVHGGFGLIVNAEGDLNVDCHHTIEDTGIVLGKAFAQALGDKSGIERYGNFTVPMDETLVMSSADISGRPYLVFNANFEDERVGEYDACMTEEFFRAFAFQAGITLHINVQYGKNSHHKIEGIYKSVAHALKIAVKQNMTGETLSTKGMLENAD